MPRDGPSGDRGGSGVVEVLDEASLEHRTFGDRALADELLRLFEAQCTAMLPVALGAGDARARREALHTLTGGAAAIGAEVVADLARRMEAGLGAADAAADELAEPLEEATVALRAAITKRLRR